MTEDRFSKNGKWKHHDNYITHSNPFEFKKTLYNIQVGSHVMVVYRDLTELREIYTSFAKHALIYNNEVVVILYHYDNPNNIRYYLQNIGIDINKYEKEHSLLILDSQEPSFFKEEQDLLLFTKLMLKKSKERGKTGISIIADMGSFFYKETQNNMELLLSFERSLPKQFTEYIKRLCLYNVKDLNKVNEKEGKDLLISHLQCLKLQDYSFTSEQ